MFYYYPQKSLGLLTDLYELTMAYGYWKNGLADHEAVFHVFFRRAPFQGELAVVAGLESIIQFLTSWKIENSDIAYLKTLKTTKGTPLFEDSFLEYLQKIEFCCDIDALTEGEIAFAYEPLLRVKGPIIQAQLLESALLNLINFPTLIATKSARICKAACPGEVIEFGLRRAQGLDGAMTASRAAFIGGCVATSNTLAGKWLDIPVAGTHAHSWVMAFDNELESFLAYARAMPDNCVFLVDTFDSLEGVEHAIIVGKNLREHGHDLLGIRLDSGDLTVISQKARQKLDEAGFSNVKIFASNELNEHVISEMKNKGAEVVVWGVGTHLVTGQNQSALEGVYKLSAVRAGSEKDFEYKLKLSENASKISDPGILQVRRFYDSDGHFLKDVIFDETLGFGIEQNGIDLKTQQTHQLTLNKNSFKDLLVPIFREGKLIYVLPSLKDIQKKAEQALIKLDSKYSQISRPETYPVMMEKQLWDKKNELIEHIQKDIKF